MGSYQTRSAGTATTSRSGYRIAESAPPKTQPVSRQAVLLIHSTVGHRGVPVEHDGLAAVVLRPRVPHGQPELVGLPRGLAVQRERAHTPGRTPVVLLLEAGVRDDELSVVEDEVRDQVVAERRDLLTEFCGLSRQLRERLLEAVRDGDLRAAQRADELGLVVSGDGERVPGCDHAHREPEDADDVGAAVDEVAEEDDAPTFGMAGVDGATLVVAADGVPEPAEQGLELAEASVHVTDGIEGPALIAAVVEQAGAFDRRRLPRLRGCAGCGPSGTLPW